MSRKTFESAKQIFRQHHGILRTAQAKKLGIHPPTLVEMTDEGVLIREARGVYRLADSPPLSNPDLIQVSLRVPKSVVCLISALNFHNLTTQIPYQVYIALPQGTKAPQIDYPPLKVIHPTEAIYLAGIEEHRIDHVPVRIYNREKTVTDCFKYRNKIGLDVALESLKDYLRLPDRNINELMYFARINGMENIMLPYLKAIL